MPGRLRRICDSITRFCSCLCCRNSSAISSPRCGQSDLPRQIKKETFRTFGDGYYYPSSQSPTRSTVSPSFINLELNNSCSSSRGSRTYRVGDAYSSDRAAHPRPSSSYWESTSSDCSYEELRVPEVASTRSSHASWDSLIDDDYTFPKFRALTLMERLKNRPVTHIQGKTNQETVESEFAGSQCTMMAYSAVSFHTFRPMGTWTRQIIDNLVEDGDANHRIYRDIFSTHPDGRIALDELPATTKLAFDQKDNSWLLLNTYLGEHSGLLFLGQTSKTRSMRRPSLKEHLKAKSADLKDASFVVTLGDFSYGVVKANDNYWYLYDSHGRLNVQEPVNETVDNGWVKGASVCRFESLGALNATLKMTHEAGTACEARLVTVIPALALDTLDDKVNKKLVPRKAPPKAQRPMSTAPPLEDGEVEDLGLEDTILLD